MSKKHYIVLAKALALQRPNPFRPSKELILLSDQWRRDVMTVADTLNTLNKTFDLRKFVEACNEEYRRSTSPAAEGASSEYKKFCSHDDKESV